MTGRRVLYVQYADPRVYPPVERGAAILRARGWQVSMLGIAAEGQSARLADGASQGEVERMRHRPGGLNALKSYIRFWKRALAKARKEKADVVYCSDILSYPAGYLIARLTSCRTVFHEHDSPASGQSGAFQRFLATMRVRFARVANLCVFPQRERAQRFEAEAGVETMLVHNCPSLAEIGEREEPASGGEGLVLWHHGSLNTGRFPPALIDALALLPDDVSLELAGYETPSSYGFVDGLLARAKELGLGDRFRFHGAMPREKLFGRARRVHVGISLFARDFGEPMVGASVKPFDYLACGLPLLVNDTAEWRDFYAHRGVAHSCDPGDPADIARAIGLFHRNAEERRAMARRGYELIRTEWNYEAQFGPVVDRLDRLVTQRATA